MRVMGMATMIMMVGLEGINIVMGIGTDAWDGFAWNWGVGILIVGMGLSFYSNIQV